MVRGINKSDIFRDDQDRQKFLERLELNLIASKCSIYAWTLMNNHVHLLLKSGGKGLSDVMRKQLTWYAMYFNRKYKRTGHLFENRYKSIICEEDRYLLALIRYIHLNPIRARIVDTLEELDKYPWSGHGVILGNFKREWMDTCYVLLQYGKTLKRAKSAYRNFINEGLSQGRIPELTGGGLIRSQGGWSEVISLRRKVSALDFDDRVLGGSEFVKRLLEETEEKKNQLKIAKPGKSISNIIAEESTKSGISQWLLCSGSRRKNIAHVRAVVAKRCTEELGATFADIARCLGVSTSAIRRSALV